MESVMQYMWKWRLYGSPDKVLTDGRPVRILHPGQQNQASGPDFFNALIVLDSMQWAGNVELHQRASDWHRHGHHNDRAYDSVMLHVVGTNDSYVQRPDGSLIPQLLMDFDPEISRRFEFLASDASPLRCRAYIASVPALFIHDAVDACAMQRLQQKADRVFSALKYTQGDWTHTTLITLARALGASLNGEPMERLARLLSPGVWGKHTDSPFQIDALAFGQAGLIPSQAPENEYPAALSKEYAFLAHKYNLTPLPAHIWKFAGGRPQAFPTRTVAAMAKFMAAGSGLLSRLLEAEGDAERLSELLAVNHDGFWKNHLTFSSPTDKNYSRALGPQQIKNLSINAVAPLYYAWGEHNREPRFTQAAQSLLENLPPEANSLTRLWTDSSSFSPKNAWDSQGIIHLTRCYCEPGDCLRCRIALQSLKKISPKGNKPTPQSVKPKE